MLATHNPKLINARTQNRAICADMIGEINPNLICSQTTAMQQKFWACPKNAADMKYYRNTLESPRLYLPDIEDPKAVKQVLVPLSGWRDGEYLSVTPLESMGVLDELNRRIEEQSLSARTITVEATPAAYANHGELMLKYAGKLSVLTRGVTQQINHKDIENTYAVGLSFEVENCNVGSGFLSMGHPAITAIGGLVHTFERALGFDIEFAIGLSSTQFRGQQRYARYNAVKKQSQWGITGELSANLSVVLLLTATYMGQIAKLADYISSQDLPINRFAGGSVWGLNVFMVDKFPPQVNYLMDASSEMPHQNDSLQAALDLYAGEKPIYSINQVGYGWLEEPQSRSLARNGYQHVWAEPIYSVVKQTAFHEGCWWSRRATKHGVHWGQHKG